MPRKGIVPIIGLTCFLTVIHSFRVWSNPVVLVCLSDVQHPRESSLYVRLMYDSSCCINRPSKRLFIFIFYFQYRSSFTHFHFLFHFFNLYLYIHISIYISRHLLTTKMHIHTHIHMFYIFYFPHQNPSTLPTNRKCKSKKRTRNIFFIYKTRYERKSGPAYLFPQLVLYHIIVIISNETCNMKT